MNGNEGEHESEDRHHHQPTVAHGAPPGDEAPLSSVISSHISRLVAKPRDGAYITFNDLVDK